jgi:N6-L-threonylcarbamoyladenine synthase
LPGGKAKLRGASKGQRAKGKAPSFPALALVVSGGHTDMVVLSSHGNIKWLGGTRDDAAGEAFDKAARLLGFDYPGGPILAQTADEFIAKNPNKKLALFPRPMLANSNLDFSFSGLKTAVLHKVASVAGSEIGFADYEKIAKNKAVQSQAPLLAAETQEAIVDVLVAKTLRAAKEHEVKSLIVGGGVSANKRLRERFVGAIASEGLAFSFHVPEPKYSTDNAEMIAAFASLNFNPMPWEEIAANPELNITG